MDVAIIGLGYVGLPLALQFARSGLHVLGLDIDAKKIDLLNHGKTYLAHIPNELIELEQRAGRFEPSADFKRIADVDAVVICVPTPLNKNREPDLSYVLKTGEQIALHIKRGTIVV